MVQTPSGWEEFEQAHASWLAGWAVAEADDGGRRSPEPPHPYRTSFQRDRERILHCTAFRRLDFKTQVFVPHEHDHFRTRLTHTLEVAQVARTLGRALRLNEDLIEAVALAHDLGHPPFGHCGEAVLADLMAGAGGFEHNRQSLRVVDYLEHPYPEFRGLNLTQVARECLAKHEADSADTVAEFDDGRQGPLEGQAVDLADGIAYTAADLDDALASGWISADDLGDLTLWQAAWQQAGESAPTARWIHRRIRARATILSLMADDAIAQTRLATESVASLDDVRRAGRPLVAFSEKMAAEVAELQRFLRQNVYEHPDNLRYSDEGQAMIVGLFKHFCAQPGDLPRRYHDRIDDGGLERVVCDYIAGMTDRFCRGQYEAFCS